MTNTELMLVAITSGLEDDGTTAAALDAIREESGCTLLGAVLEVARVWHAARKKRDLAEATSYLAKDSTIKADLEQEIAAECPNVSVGAYITIITEEGDHWPRAVDTSLFADGAWVRSFHISVGALWVKRVANRLMLERERAARRPRRRHSN